MAVLVHHIAQLIVALVEVWLCYQLLFATVIDKDALGPIEKCAIWINILGVGILLASNRNGAFFSRLMFIFCIVVTWLFVVGIVRDKIFLSLGIIISYYAITALLDLLFAFGSLHFFKNRFENIIYFKARSLHQIIIFMCSRIIVTLIIHQISKTKEIKNNIREYKNIILGISIALCIVLRQYQVILDGMIIGEQRMSSKSGFSLLVVIIILIILEVVLLKNKIVQKENMYLTLKDKITEQMYQELLQSNEKHRQLSHDVKNHFLILSKYEKEGDLENIHNYLEELNQEYIYSENKIWTGNKVLDFLLNQKKSMAEQKDIEFLISTTVALKLPFSMSEICSLFGNLLDNSIEACERIDIGKRWIRVRMNKKEGLFFIEIVNSIKDLPSEESGKLISTKPEKDVHGYGLKCVQRIVDKYEGILEYHMDTNQFQIDITFFNM